MPDEKVKKIMLIAGEASGDAHGAALVRQIRETQNGANIEFFGCVGSQMKAENVDQIVDSDQLAIVGVAEILRALPNFLYAKKKILTTATERRPDLVILIDFPEFNLKLAKKLKQIGCKIVYYISPQLWAWREYRIRTIKKYVDLLITILPFEKKWYFDRGVTHVEYSGNPLSKKVRSTTSREEFRRSHNIDIEQTLVALLPGSRGTEIKHIFPDMLDAAEIMSERSDDIAFVVCAAPTRDLSELERLIKSHTSDRTNIKIVQNETYDALNAADVAAVTSGTATLEAGLIGIPMAVVYKGTGINYKILRPLISVEHFGLVNLIAGRRLATELIQSDLTPVSLAGELERLIDKDVNRSMRDDLKVVSERLTAVPDDRQAAKLILDLFDK